MNKHDKIYEKNEKFFFNISKEKDKIYEKIDYIQKKLKILMKKK